MGGCKEALTVTHLLGQPEYCGGANSLELGQPENCGAALDGRTLWTADTRLLYLGVMTDYRQAAAAVTLCHCYMRIVYTSLTIP